MKLFLFLTCTGFFLFEAQAQQVNEQASNSGWFSLGMRSSYSSFSHDGSGLGMGGQFRIQVNNKVNTDWFADYISINQEGKVRSDYYHIGWSVLFYPFEKMEFTKKVQPYVLAGHCFDYNRKTSIRNPDITMSRWGSAVQGGLGAHFYLSERIDLSVIFQYMVHLTTEVDADIDGDLVTMSRHKNSSLEGHMLSTVSLNYKIGKLWNRK